MTHNPILDTISLGMQWPAPDPFLFCVHHYDAYPAGADNMGPEPTSLKGRNIGSDFEPREGWRMYHGSTVPGFPVHPHRGFETITIVQDGLVDHADSMGAAGRYGAGDTQWMTAGKGVQHSEMFPLIQRDRPNTLQLFQIWINLPQKSKFVDPHFVMFWHEDTPRKVFEDEQGAKTQVEVVAGRLEGIQPLAPPPDSWAADSTNEVAIWLIDMDANASWTLPPASKEVHRVLYFYEGESLGIADTTLNVMTAAVMRPEAAVALHAGKQRVRLLLLQGKPIAEPVAQYGPFVMNTREEIQQAYNDFQETHFGGWSWEKTDQVHPRDKRRFAKFPDGREEAP